MGRLLTKATWGMLPRAAFVFSDECCGAIAADAAIGGRWRRGWRRRGCEQGVNRAVAMWLARAGCAAAVVGGLCG